MGVLERERKRGTEIETEIGNHISKKSDLTPEEVDLIKQPGQQRKRRTIKALTKLRVTVIGDYGEYILNMKSNH